tara:strand:- start:225 stop:362 length:138 start_codon:yes stop_codon:yes gene_type:complete
MYQLGVEPEMEPGVEPEVVTGHLSSSVYDAPSFYRVLNVYQTLIP